MSITLRIILILSSILSFILCIKRIKQSKLKVTNSMIWMLGSLILILMSIFSEGVEWIAIKLGFIAPVNLAFLLIEVFINNVRITQLNEKIKELAHCIALKEAEEKSNEKKL